MIFIFVLTNHYFDYTMKSECPQGQGILKVMTPSVDAAYGGFACLMRRAGQFAGFSLHLKIVKIIFVIFYE